MVKAPDVGTTTGKNLLYIGTSTQYIQTANYVQNTSGTKIDLATGKIEGYSDLTLKGGTTGSNGSFYLSTTDTTATIAGASRSGLRLTIGSGFGVDKNGKLYASGAYIGGSSTISDDSQIGGRTVSELKAQADEAHVDAYTLMNTAYVQQLVNNTVGGWHI